MRDEAAATSGPANRAMEMRMAIGSFRSDRRARRARCMGTSNSTGWKGLEKWDYMLHFEARVGVLAGSRLVGNCHHHQFSYPLIGELREMRVMKRIARPAIRKYAPPSSRLASRIDRNAVTEVQDRWEKVPHLKGCGDNRRREKVIVRLVIQVLFFVAALAGLAPVLATPQETVTIAGVVRSPSGSAITEARVTVLDALRLPVKSAVTGPDGRFTIAGLPHGRYILSVDTPGFERNERVILLGEEAPAELVIDLPAGGTERVVVTAAPGVPQDAGATSQAVNVADEQGLALRAKTLLAQAAAEQPRLHPQRPSPTHGAIFVRGLTGAKVNAFVDGIRFSNGAARGGINTFFDMFDSDLLQGLEVLRGPSSAQYGSDAIGGSIQLMTRAPRLSPGGKEAGGGFSTQVNSADQSVGAAVFGSYATPGFGILGTVSSRRVDDVRPGEEVDSHNAVTRFFEIPSDVVIDDRLPDTSFNQYDGSVRFIWQPVEGSQLTGAYLHGQQEHGQRYDQLLGGDGNLIADLDHVTADLAYVKYERALSGWLDRLTVGGSFNTQR